MGDVAMTVPVIRAFVQQHPTVKITFLSKPFLKPLFENIDNVSFYAAQVKGPHKGFFGLYKLFKELKARNITEVADLHNVLRSKFLRSLFRISGVRVSYINKGRVEKRALTRIKNKIFEQLKTTHQRYVEVFDNLGFKVDISNPEFPTPDPLSEKIKNITGTKKEAWIGIAPFAQYQSKMYPLDLMEQVIGELSKAKAIKITGLRRERMIVIDNYIKDKDKREYYKNSDKITGMSGANHIKDLSENKIPAFDINLSSKNAMFKYGDLPKSVQNININSKIINKTGLHDKNRR